MIRQKSRLSEAYDFQFEHFSMTIGLHSRREDAGEVKTHLARGRLSHHTKSLSSTDSLKSNLLCFVSIKVP